MVHWHSGRLVLGKLTPFSSALRRGRLLRRVARTRLGHGVRRCRAGSAVLFIQRNSFFVFGFTLALIVAQRPRSLSFIRRNPLFPPFVLFPPPLDAVRKSLPEENRLDDAEVLCLSERRAVGAALAREDELARRRVRDLPARYDYR